MGQENARAQEVAVMDWFMEHSERGATPEQLWVDVFDRRVPLTSVRRAFSDLASAGRLDKTHATRPGLYGVEVRVWRLAVPTAQMELV